MTDNHNHAFHRLHGPARRRIFYKKTDYADYLLMLALCAGVLWFSYAGAGWLQGAGLVLCGFMVFSFPARHGFALTRPMLPHSARDGAYLLFYKLQNMQPVFLVAVAVLALDQLFIALTPDWPHHSALMAKLALALFYLHLGGISLYRLVILASHLRHRERVRAVLSETSWRGALEQQPNVTLHLVHACATGLLTHLVLLAPWYLVITHVRYSVLSLLLISVVNVVVHIFHLRGYSAWFYREHWLAHNAELDFVYLHGSHHDAIPCGLIGVSGNGFLEGFLRHTVGNPMSLYSPPLACLLHTLEVVQDIRMHQYIPGVFPSLGREFHEVSQHSTHHFGRLEPYGIGLRLVKPEGAPRKQGWLGFPPESLLNSISLDEELNGFQWDNPRYQRFMAIYDKYQPKPDGQPQAQSADQQDGARQPVAPHEHHV
jgi:hypothetical protein